MPGSRRRPACSGKAGARRWRRPAGGHGRPGRGCWSPPTGPASGPWLILVDDSETDRRQCEKGGGQYLCVWSFGDPPADRSTLRLSGFSPRTELRGTQLDFETIVWLVDEHVRAGVRMLGCGGVAELTSDPDQPRLHPFVLSGFRSTSVAAVGPVVTGPIDGLETGSIEGCAGCSGSRRRRVRRCNQARGTPAEAAGPVGRPPSPRGRPPRVAWTAADAGAGRAACAAGGDTSRYLHYRTTHRQVYPRFVRALFGVEEPLNEWPDEASIAADLDLAPIRRAVAALLPSEEVGTAPRCR